MILLEVLSYIVEITHIQLFYCVVLFYLEKQLDGELQKYLDNAELLHHPARAIIAPYPKQYTYLCVTANEAVLLILLTLRDSRRNPQGCPFVWWIEIFFDSYIFSHAGYSYCGPCGAFAYKQIIPANM